MEMYTIKRRNCGIHVLFTGQAYIFYNQFYGLLAVAERKGYEGTDFDTFTIRHGNSQCVGGSFGGNACFEIAKQFISKQERRYTPDRALCFKELKEDLRHSYLDVQVKNY